MPFFLLVSLEKRRNFSDERPFITKIPKKIILNRIKYRSIIFYVISQRNASSARQILDYMAQVFSNVAHISFVLSFRIFWLFHHFHCLSKRKNGMQWKSYRKTSMIVFRWIWHLLSTTGIRLIVIWYLLINGCSIFSIRRRLKSWLLWTWNYNIWKSFSE